MTWATGVGYRDAGRASCRSERFAVVRENARDTRAQALEVPHRRAKERYSAVLVFVGVDLRDGNAAVVVHSYEDVLPADVAGSMRAVPVMRSPTLSKRPSLLMSMCACKYSLRRKIASATWGSIARGDLFGREDLSRRPAAPSDR